MADPDTDSTCKRGELADTDKSCAGANSLFPRDDTNWFSDLTDWFSDLTEYHSSPDDPDEFSTCTQYHRSQHAPTGDDPSRGCQRRHQP